MAESPLYRDPVFDGAADPTVIRHHESGEWWMFYTQRRATVDEPGVAWVHGSAIGVAVSADGLQWDYRGTVSGVDAGGNTHWAPEVIRHDGRYRMYLTVIAGVPDRWEGHDRRIVELWSDDLESWTPQRVLELGSHAAIDAAVARCADGLWRLWFKNEADESTTWAARSADLDSWTVEGRIIGPHPHEGPNVFELGGWFWMIVDEWRGQGVYRSDDGVRWQRQEAAGGLILDRPGIRAGDAAVGRHADVVVHGDRATVFYFTHPWWDGRELDEAASVETRRTVVQAASLEVVDGRLVCDRDDAGSIERFRAANHK